MSLLSSDHDLFRSASKWLISTLYLEFFYLLRVGESFESVELKGKRMSYVSQASNPSGPTPQVHCPQVPSIGTTVSFDRYAHSGKIRKQNKFYFPVQLQSIYMYVRKRMTLYVM